MANLTSVNINGALIRKEGTTTTELTGATMFPAAHQVFSTEYIFQASIAVDPNNANKFVAAYRDITNDKGCVRIGTVQSNNTIVWGAESIFNDTQTNKISVAWDYNSSTSYIVVAYSDSGNSSMGSARIGTVSGTSISGWGTERVISNTSPNHQTSWTYVAFDPNTPGKFALAEDQHLSVCTHNGTAITQGTIVECESGNQKGGPVIWDPNDATKFITVYKDNSGELHGRVCQVSGTTITLQAVQTIESSTVDSSDSNMGLDASPHTANQFTTSYRMSDGKGRVRIMNVAGSAGSWTLIQSPYYEFSTNAVESVNLSYTTAPNNFIVTYRDINNNNYGTAREGTISSGTTGNPPYYTLTGWETAVVFNSGDTRLGHARHTALDKTTNKFVIAYDTAGTDGVVKVGVAKQNKITVDLSTGNYFEVDLQNATGSITTFTITEALSGTQAQTFFLKVTQGSTARQFDWSSVTNIKWPGSSGPTLSTGNDAVDIFRFTTYDQGTTWNGETIGLNFS